MGRLLRGLCALLVCALALTGCSAFSMGNAADLLRAPALGEEPGAIQKALTASVGEVVYKYPKEGQNHSPLLLADLDGDGVDEGIVFYNQVEGNNVSMAILQKQGGAWTLAATVQGAREEVASVDVVDIYGDGTQLLVVGYSNASLGSKTLMIYEYTGGEIIPSQGGGYSSYLLDDFTGRGGTDLAVVVDGDTGLSLQLITGQNERAREIRYLQESIPLSDTIGACAGIHISTNEEGRLFLVVDGILATSKYLATQVLVYSESAQKFYVRESDTAGALYSLGDTVRPLAQFTSRDIDGDGTVETPVLLDMEEGTVDEDLGVVFVEWIDFTPEEPVTKYFGLFDTATNLYVRLPDDWREGGLRVAATEAGWRVRPADSALTVLEYRVLDGEENEALPENARHLEGLPGAYLIPSGTLSAVDLYIIDSALLV